MKRWTKWSPIGKICRRHSFGTVGNDWEEIAASFALRAHSSQWRMQAQPVFARDGRWCDSKSHSPRTGLKITKHFSQAQPDFALSRWGMMQWANFIGASNAVMRVQRAKACTKLHNLKSSIPSIAGFPCRRHSDINLQSSIFNHQSLQPVFARGERRWDNEKRFSAMYKIRLPRRQTLKLKY